MACGICGKPSNGIPREDPAHADCIRQADSRIASELCAVCGDRPIEDGDGRCNVCREEAGLG